MDADGCFCVEGNDWVNPDDLTAVAEMELLGAANSIEAAAKKLAELQPRPQPQVRERGIYLFMRRVTF